MKWFGCILAIAIAGCGLPRSAERAVTVLAYDFREYQGQDFLLTPESYTGEYESVGLVQLFMLSAVKPYNPNEEQPNWQKTRIFDVAYLVEKPNTRELIEEAVAIAKKMGADGLIRFSITRSFEFNGLLQVPAYTLNAFAIKRK